MEAFIGALAFWTTLASLAFYIVIIWVLIRFARAIEKIADNLWTISRTNTRTVEAIEKVADRIERVAENTNVRK